MDTCVICGKEINLIRRAGRKTSVCSKKCRNKRDALKKQGKPKPEFPYQGKYQCICEKCGTVFHARYQTAKFCSVECYRNRNFSVDLFGNKTLRCGICKQYKQLTSEHFYYSKQNSFGFSVYCKVCELKKTTTIEAKAYRKINRAKPHNAAKIKEYNKNRYATPEYKQDRNAKEKLKKQTDPCFALKTRMRILMYASIRQAKNGRKWEELVGYTIDELRNHIENLFAEGMTWERFMNGEIHIDHKIPVSSFNFSCPEDEDFKKCWALNNLQPMWAVDNIKKSNKIQD